MMTQTTEEQTAAAWGDYGTAGMWAPVLSMLAEEDSRIARALQQNDAAMSQLRTCDWTMSGYPHPGCAEFGPPDVFTCSNVATLRSVWRDLTPYALDPEACEFPGDEHPEIGVQLCCTEHVGDLVLDDQFAELLYVEWLDTGERLDPEHLEQLRAAQQRLDELTGGRS